MVTKFKLQLRLASPTNYDPPTQPTKFYNLTLLDQFFLIINYTATRNEYLKNCGWKSSDVADSVLQIPVVLIKL